MAVKFDSFKDMCDHMQQVCNSFNHLFEVKVKTQESVLPSEKEIEAHSSRMGESKEMGE